LEISGFEVLTTVTQNNTFLWGVTICSLEKFSDILGRTPATASVDGCSRIFRKVGKFLR